MASSSSAPPPAAVPGVFDCLRGPWIFMSASLAHLPQTIVALVRQRAWGTLFSWSRFQTAWFGRFWEEVGPGVRQGAGQMAEPLLRGLVRRGEVLSPGDKPAHPPISGVVLEIGAGSGLWAEELTAHEAVTRVYGIEPNPQSAAALRGIVAALGKEDVYQVVPVGVENLSEEGSWGKIEEGSIDCIVSVLALCSIPDPEENIKTLYRYLKKGGRWYLFEHQKMTWARQAGWGMRLYQAFVNLFWPTMIGGCTLNRESAKWVMEAGPWESIDVVQPVDEPRYVTLPHACGVLTK